MIDMVKLNAYIDERIKNHFKREDQDDIFISVNDAIEFLKRNNLPHGYHGRSAVIRLIRQNSIETLENRVSKKSLQNFVNNFNK